MRKLLIGGGVASMLIIVVLAGAVFVIAQGLTATDAGADKQSPSYSSSILVNDTQNEGMTEANESAALAGLATITPEQAKNSALNAYPGATVIKVKLDNENGAVVYSVELDNGLDVKIDTGNGDVLYSDSGNDLGDFDNDNIQHEFQGEEEHQD
jgi:uncharacterized membrane protein YkoI